MPELPPVTIAFWPLSNLRFSVFGTTGFGRSPKVCACGIFGFGRLIASGGMVGMGFLFLFCRFVVETLESLQSRGPLHRHLRKDFWIGSTNGHEQRQFRFHHHRLRRGRRHFGISPRSEWQENLADRARTIREAREGKLELARSER